MLFSSISFTYHFLPVVFALYFLLPVKLRNIILLISSLFFYFYGEPKYVLLMLFSSAVDYSLSLVINRYRGTKKAKYALMCSIIVNLLILGFFKYSDFFISNINALFNANIPLLKIPLPLGVSFYTFQTMSYTIDIYRNEAQIQKNPLNFATYVSLFPQLVAGPIVRYQTVANEMTNRKHSFENFSYGASRFIIGLGKKVLIANILGELNDIALKSANQSVLFYWLGIIAFSLQIYFDFSGYSDMAIGLGRIFGFHFLENFNYPYISESISEFWNRWHISLGTWFREYLYIPLGGNRVSKLKWIRNIFIVWFCTGFWHGASWNFIIWGLYFGIIIALEKVFLLNCLKKIPRALRHVYVVSIVIFSFVIFNSETLPDILTYFKGMFGFLSIPAINAESLYYLRSYVITLIAAFLGSTPFMKNMVNKAETVKSLRPAVNVAYPVLLLGLLLVVTAYLIDSSFNPFLYFRF